MGKQKIKKISAKREIKLTKKQKDKLLKIEKKITNAKILKKIQSILLKDKDWTHADIAKHLNKSVSSVSGWIKIYKEQGLKQLISWNYQGKASKLSQKQLNKLKARAKEEPFDIAQEALDYIEKEFDIKYNVKYMPRLLKKTNCHIKSLV